MKTAIILVGNIRTWDTCKQSFINTFRDLNADIFITTYDIKYSYTWGGHLSGEDYILNEHEIKQCVSDLNVKSILIENTEYINGLVDIEQPKWYHPNLPEVWFKSAYSQYRKIKTGLDLMVEYENSNDIKYDCVIKTRFDITHNPINFVDLKSNVIIGSCTTPPTDCIIISNRDNVINITDFAINEFYNPIYENSWERPPHVLLENAVKNSNLNFDVQDICQLVRQNV